MPDGTELVNLPPAGLPADPPDETPDLPENPGTLVHAEHWSGPLPPPAALQRYDEVLPGAAERILAMAETEQQHRMEQEKAFVAQEQYNLETARITHAAESGRSKLGLIFAFIIVLVGIGAGVGLVVAGHGGFGAGFLFASLATLAGAFIYTDQARRAERRRNSQDD